MNQSRLQRVIENMKEQGLSQTIVSSTASVYYLTGLWIEPHERMLALYIHIDGEVILFGNELFSIQDPGEGLDFIAHTDSDNPVKQLAETVKKGTLGIDKFWSSKFLIGLMELRPDIQPVLGSLPIDQARLYKDADEIAAMRHASAINDQVVEAAIASIKGGVTELDLAGIVNKNYIARGADCEGPQLVCFGPNGSDPHHAPDGTVLKKGDGIIFDIFTPIQRYWCDMTRTVFFGSVSEEQRKIYEIVKEANLTAISIIKPGLPLSQFDKAARDVITKAGYGPYFTHRLGHGIGLECHEPHDVSSASTQIIAKPGMIFSCEPGIYLPGRLGVRIEDLVMITENGCEVLNSASKDLRVIE